MSDGIFTDEELKATEATPETELTPGAEVEQGGEGRARGPDGKFLPKEEPEAVVEETEAEPKKGDGTVPQGALHAEREKRKGSDERATKAEAELKAVREQLAALAKMRDEVAARKPADLPAADDPAAIEHLRTRLGEIEQGQNRISQQMDNEALANHEIQQLGSFMADSEAHYREQKPDYDDAINHVVQMRANELALYGLNRAQIQQTISEEATEIVRAAVQQGRDPAELGYQIALSRGYRPAEGEAAPAKTNGSGGAQATIDAIAKAKAQGKSLGGGGGSSPKNLTAETVAAMSGDEFEALYSTPEGKALIDAL